ncbi:MAG: FmdB family zinc ribbon protein [Acidobacteriota bacterium]
MPIYDYRCEDCSARYEVFHKVREETEEIICPKCQSRRYKKMMSVPAAAVMGSSASDSFSAGGGSCDGAGGCGCSGGACGLN